MSDDLLEHGEQELAKLRARRIRDAVGVFQMQRMDSFCALIESDTGVYAKNWTKREKDPEVIALTNMIARKMEEAGEDVMLRDIVPLSLVSGQNFLVPRSQRHRPISIEEWRNIVFLPSVGAMRRRRFQRAMDYMLFMMEGENSSREWGEKWAARMWVATYGPRVTVKELRYAIKILNRRISLMNREMQKAGWECEIVFRNIELGDVVDDMGNPILNEKGEQTYHVHSHILLILKRYYEPEQWKKLLAYVRGKLCPEDGDGSRWWNESGEAVNTKELLKYFLKPHNLSALSGEELVKVFHAIRKLHLCQPMGELRNLMRDLEKEGEILLPPGPACDHWRREKNPNQKKPRKDDLPDELDPDDLSDLVADDFCEDELVATIEENAVPDRQPRVLCWKPPIPVADAVCYPHLLVRCDPDDLDDYLDALLEKPEIQQFVKSMRVGLERNAYRGSPEQTVSYCGKEWNKAELDSLLGASFDGVPKSRNLTKADYFAEGLKAKPSGCYPGQPVDNWSGEPPPLPSQKPPDKPPEPPPF